MIYNDTIYHDIVPDNRMIFGYTMTIGENRISASLATVELKPDSKGTRLVFTEQGAFLDGLDQVADRKQGWREILGHLARELERDAAAA